jgi:hypothetical protein
VANVIQGLRLVRTRRLRAAALIAIVLIAGSGWRAAPATRPSVRTQDAGTAAAAAMAHLPLSFVENRGQMPDGVVFSARDGDADLLFTPTGFLTRLRGSGAGAPPDDLRVQMAGARTDAAPISLERAEGVVNIFEGNDPSRWRTGIPTHARIGYAAPWPGIDVRYDGRAGQLESTYAVATGADPGMIRLRYSGHDGLELAPDGGLLIRTRAGLFSESAPVIYQEIGAQRVSVQGRFDIVDHDTVGFVVAQYDRGYPLLIDPLYTHAALAYSTYYGGTGSDQANAIAVDASGNAYVAGFTTSGGLPGPPAAVLAARDAFVLKLTATGLLGYFTYLGGLDVDEAKGIAVTAAGEAYVTGSTASGDFPIATPFQALNAGGAGTLDAFVTKLSITGVPTYSTYLGGGGDDTGRGIAVLAGKVFVTGTTTSGDFPSLNAPALNALLGLSDAFVTKLDPAMAGAAQLLYSQYLGGSLLEDGRAIAVDTAGEAFVTGSTRPPNPNITLLPANDFPSTVARIGPAPLGVGGEIEDAFVTKLTAAGARTYSVLVGGVRSVGGTGSDGADGGYGIAVKSDGTNAYVTGLTHSANFPLLGAVQPTYGGGDDAFVTKLNGASGAAVYSTYLGGSGGDAGAAIAVNSLGEAIVTGSTFSTNFPFWKGFQSTHGGGTGSNADAFVTRINAAGSALIYSSYLGGAATDRGWGVAAGPGADDAYVAGSTTSNGFPVTAGVVQLLPSTSGDAFVSRIAVVTSSVGGVSTAPDLAALPARGAGEGASANPIALAILAAASLAAVGAAAYARRRRG